MKNKELVTLVLALWMAICLIGCSNDAQSTGADTSTGSDDTVALNELPDLSAHAEDTYDVDTSAENNSDASPERKPTIEELESIPIEEAMPWLGEVEAEDTNYVDPDIVEADAADVPEDPYEMYAVWEDWAREYGGIFVERNGTLYSATSVLPVENVDTYGVGCKVNHDVSWLYIRDGGEVDDTTFTKTPMVIMACGEFPILQVSKTEQLRGYYRDTKVNLISTDFVGWTIPVLCYYGGGYYYGGRQYPHLLPLIDHAMPLVQGDLYNLPQNNLGIYDAGDNLVQDFRDLDYGGRYSLVWWSGADYYEYPLIADCAGYRAYNEVGQMKWEYVLEGQLTKNGYVTFDLSGIEPGYYVINIPNAEAVIEITE